MRVRVRMRGVPVPPLYPRSPVPPKAEVQCKRSIAEYRLMGVGGVEGDQM